MMVAINIYWDTNKDQKAIALSLVNFTVKEVTMYAHVCAYIVTSFTLYCERSNNVCTWLICFHNYKYIWFHLKTLVKTLVITIY